MEEASVEPTVVPLDLLREITNDFSEERKLGSGSFGKVYLGVRQDGEKIAVKMLYDMPGLDDKQFQNEFKNLTRLRHQNIVRLVGYCHDIQEVQVKYEGKLVLAEKTHRALCLEYMSNGSLDKYLSDECDRYDWHKGYRIIKGICQGLKYLHDELKPPIYHLDLKPANVLLDENMVPRIADFGMSRLFRDELTQATKSPLGTLGYLPPEYIKNNLVSKKFDIFSLGVIIIKIMAGRAGYFTMTDMSSQEFSNLVQENWTNRLLETSNRRNSYSKQVKICIEIGISCVQEDRHKRPTIQDIVDRLNETETECTYAARKDWLLIFEEANRNASPQYAQDPNDRHAEKIYHGSTFSPYAQDIEAATHSNYFKQNPGLRESRLDDDLRFYRNDNEEHSVDGDPLPGIEGFHIAGDPRPGFTLRACGFATNGTTRGKFQRVHYLEDGIMRPIEGATVDDYVVTADDVDSLLAVDCTPMDDNGRQKRKYRTHNNHSEMRRKGSMPTRKSERLARRMVLMTSVLLTQRKKIGVGEHFQAEIPEWTGPPSDAERSCYRNDPNISKMLGSRTWPPEGQILQTDIVVAGQGRPECSCPYPGSYFCRQHHINTARDQLRSEIGQAFTEWKFDSMGDEVSKKWSIDEQLKFNGLERLVPTLENKSFWAIASKHFAKKPRRDLVQYYMNVFLMRRVVSQCRLSLLEIDSDEDEAEEEEDEDQSDGSNSSQRAQDVQDVKKIS